jgi:hypothetical protein
VCQKIITGGQTGVDRGALDACLEIGFPTGGWCPKNRRAEDGIIPEKYDLQETAQKEYKFRTEKNVRNAEGTVIISPSNLTGGTLLTKELCHKFNKPYLIIQAEKNSINNKVSKIISFLEQKKIITLNIAGPRLSEWNNSYQISKQIITSLLNRIK